MDRLLWILGFLTFQTCLAFNAEDYNRWYATIERESLLPAPEVACDWTLPDAGIFKKNYVVVCPADCLGYGHCVSVRGSNPYSVHSPICLSAIHAGVISSEFGGAVNVTVIDAHSSKEKRDHRESREGSFRNGIESRPSSNDFALIKFGKADTTGWKPTTTPEPICPCCRSAATDVVFVVDSSVSVGAKNFKLAMEFLKDLTRLFTISKKDTRIGLITFNSFPTTWMKLTRWTTKEDVLKQMDSIPYQEGGTYIGKALYRVSKDMIFRSGPDVEKMVIMLSDGHSLDSVERPVAILAAKNVKTISIGIGRSRPKGVETLEKIAYGIKENVYSIASYSALSSYVSSVTRRIGDIIKCPK